MDFASLATVPCRTVMCLGRLHARFAPPAIITTTDFATPRTPQMEPIDAALAAIDALESGEKLVYAQIAKKHGVEPTTLRRRHQGLTTSRATYHENRRALHPQQEIELIQCIDRISKQGLPPSREMVRRLASQLAQKEIVYH